MQAVVSTASEGQDGRMITQRMGSGKRARKPAVSHFMPEEPFYRKGLFHDRIVLDQAWALEAIYAVFNADFRGGKSTDIFRVPGQHCGDHL
jgi:hypothetical protein